MGKQVVIPSEFSGGIKPKLGQCRAEVETRWSGHQCKRPDGYGAEAMMCKQHARQAYKNGWSKIQ